jgi:RNA methyltransferase, TrmH family
MLLKSRIKYIQSLGQKKFREEEGVFVAEGPKLINELLQAKNTPLLGLYALKDWFDSNPPHAGHLNPSEMTEISDRDLERISFLSTPNQVLGLFKKPVFPALGPEGGVGLLLDGIRDPGNLGTIIRIADWFAVQRIFCSRDSADAFNPKTIQSTMGSICRVQIDYGDLLEMLSAHPQIPVYGSLMKGVNVLEMDRIREGLILVGNESSGIRGELLERVRYPITIPGRGGAESLNAAVATGIILSRLVG